MGVFYSLANKPHFHKNGFAVSPVLTERVLELGNGTRQLSGYVAVSQLVSRNNLQCTCRVNFVVKKQLATSL